MQRFSSLLLIPLIALFITTSFMASSIALSIERASCPEWSEQDARQKLEQLNQEIQHHNQLYFVRQMPVLSDHEFDALAKRLQVLSDCFPDIELNTGTTERLPPDNTLDKSADNNIQHVYSMGSLRKAESDKDISEFLQRVFRANDHSGVMLQPKIDGIAIELVYHDGKLVSASTRGDGMMGKNILAKVKAIPAIPDEVPVTYGRIVLHGELFVRLDRWNEKTHNRERYSSARHFVAGIIHSNAPELSALEVLDFFPWALFQPSAASSESETVNQLYSMGFDLPTQFTEPVKSLEEVIRKRDQLRKQADRLPFLLDGVVLKANSTAQQLAMGSSNVIPNWALAWKFPPDVAVTTVRNIEFKVGRTGTITPVVMFEPVEIRGQAITRVSLGSLNNLQGKDIAIGDQISIALKGSATPTFNKVVLRDSQRKHPVLPDSQRYTPFTCLSLAPDCKEQFIARIQWLTKRLDLPGLDEPVIHHLVNSGQVKTLADVLTLSKEQLQKAGNSGEQSGYFRSAIELTGSLPFGQQIRALGIPDIGKARSAKLGKAFSDWDQLLQAKDEQLQAITDVGEATIRQLRLYLQRPENQALIRILKQLQGRQ